MIDCYRCFAHLLQLAIKGAIEKTKEVQEILQLLQTLAAHLREPLNDQHLGRLQQIAIEEERKRNKSLTSQARSTPDIDPEAPIIDLDEIDDGSKAEIDAADTLEIYEEVIEEGTWDVDEENERLLQEAAAEHELDHFSALAFGSFQPPQLKRKVKMVISNATRWNSTFFMIERFLVLKPFIEQGVKELVFDRIARDVLDKYLELYWIYQLLYPAYIITVASEAESLPIYPEVFHLLTLYRDQLRTMSGNRLPTVIKTVPKMWND